MERGGGGRTVYLIFASISSPEGNAERRLAIEREIDPTASSAALSAAKCVCQLTCFTKKI